MKIVWDSEPTDKKILITCPDASNTIYHLRHINALSEYAPNIVLEVVPELYELCLYCFPNIKVVYRRDDAMEVVEQYYISQGGVNDWRSDGSEDYTYPIDHLFTTPYIKPYIDVPPNYNPNDWLVQGLCWKGKNTLSDDAVQEIASNGDYLNLNEDQFKNLFELARAIATLDQIFTVESVVAHLAGAMGKTTWLLGVDKFDYDYPTVSIK